MSAEALRAFEGDVADLETVLQAFAGEDKGHALAIFTQIAGLARAALEPKPAKFVQIASNPATDFYDSELYALDESGQVWKRQINPMAAQTWQRVPMEREPS